LGCLISVQSPGLRCHLGRGHFWHLRTAPCVDRGHAMVTNSGDATVSTAIGCWCRSIPSRLASWRTSIVLPAISPASPYSPPRSPQSALRCCTNWCRRSHRSQCWSIRPIPIIPRPRRKICSLRPCSWDARAGWPHSSGRKASRSANSAADQVQLKTAKALGLTISETLLATADEVIQRGAHVSIDGAAPTRWPWLSIGHSQIRNERAP